MRKAAVQVPGQKQPLALGILVREAAPGIRHIRLVRAPGGIHRKL